jgi:hypothetical protein
LTASIGTWRVGSQTYRIKMDFRTEEAVMESLPFIDDRFRTSPGVNEKFYPSNAQISSGKKFRQEWEKSIKNPQEYWSEKAKSIDWFKPASKVLDDSNPPFYKWFPDGELNISYNALDRHVKSNRKTNFRHTFPDQWF